VVHDPKGLTNAERVYPHLTYEPDLTAALSGAELVVLGTEWREYREMDPATTGNAVANRAVIDARNALDSQAWKNAGWTYRALGRPTV
jgi:UDPglucose 6-dehydrogenase